MSETDTKSRDRSRTTERLIQAAIDILREEGFDRLGVNAVAERAGVSKVLIYRYFGDYDGLLTAVADRVTPLDPGFAKRILSTTGDTAAPAEVVRHIVDALHRSVAENELLQQILIWELSEDNDLTRAMARQREETGRAQSEALRTFLRSKGVDDKVDVDALVALITAGVFYLTLRSRTVEQFNGIDLRSDEGWERIADALPALLRPVR
jgi:AcrR family transcriptional regulator